MVPRLIGMTVVALLASNSLQASEKRDIAPGETNWHRYRIHVIAGAGQVAVRQHITVLWDNSQAGMLIALYNTDNPSAPKLQAISTGNDRFAALDVGLLAGTYQIILAAVVAPTHYHLNSTYGRDELLFQQPNGPLGGRPPIELFTERLIEDELAPHVAKLRAALAP